MSRSNEALAMSSREEEEEEEEEEEGETGEGGEDEAGEETIKVDGDDDETKTDDSTEMECR